MHVLLPMINASDKFDFWKPMQVQMLSNKYIGKSAYDS
jgi:hypothetical protein